MRQPAWCGSLTHPLTAPTSCTYHTSPTSLTSLSLTHCFFVSLFRAASECTHSLTHSLTHPLSVLSWPVGLVCVVSAAVLTHSLTQSTHSPHSPHSLTSLTHLTHKLTHLTHKLTKFVHSFIRSFVRSLVLSFVRSFVRLFVCLLLRCCALGRSVPDYCTTALPAVTVAVADSW